MSDLRIHFGFILAIALLPLLGLCLYLTYLKGSILWIALSFLIWLLAYAAIWLSIDKLIFGHLRRIKIASYKFSKGDLDARIGNIIDAPVQITELASTFDTVADRLSERELKLKDNLKEKEILLREIHHRVKNNLQIIISLLNIKERKLTDTASIEAIKETRGRINAIALVHRGLYEGKDIRVIDMQVFMTRLINELSNGLGIIERQVSIELNLEPLKFDPDTAIPTALFIVEALTNAVQHGVKDKGIIVIDLVKSDDTIKASISDNGIGTKKSPSKGTGTKLMKGFARQLGGQLSWPEVKEGFTICLSFEHSKSSEAKL